MGRCIHKQNDLYAIWSSIVDDYVSPAMTRAELEEWIVADAKAEALDELNRTLARIGDSGGCSGHIPFRHKDINACGKFPEKERSDG